MSLKEYSKIREVSGITLEQRQRIYDFLQGAVYCWCKNRDHEWFSMRDLMGGDNYYWQRTPLYALYEKHEGKSDDPFKEAGKDSGWLLKRVIHEDKREFETTVDELVRKYRWTGTEYNE